MAGILTDMESAETFKAYESYLLGQPVKAGTVLRQGAFLYIWKERFETNGTVLQTSYGTVVTTLDSESKTLFACREFWAPPLAFRCHCGAVGKRNIHFSGRTLDAPGRLCGMETGNRFHDVRGDCRRSGNALRHQRKDGGVRLREGRL